MDLNDKSLGSLQPKVSPWRYILESQANEINFDLKTVQPNSISKIHIAIRFNLLHFWPSVPSFVFAVLLKFFFTILFVVILKFLRILWLFLTSKFS